jgi:hypothetical protein
VFLELGHLVVGRGSVLLDWSVLPPAGDERLVVAGDVVLEDGDVAAG